MTNTENITMAQILEKPLTQDLSIETDDTPPAAKSKGIAKTVMLDIEKHNDNTTFNKLIGIMQGYVDKSTKYDPDNIRPDTLDTYTKVALPYFSGTPTENAHRINEALSERQSRGSYQLLKSAILNRTFAMLKITSQHLHFATGGGIRLRDDLPKNTHAEIVTILKIMAPVVEAVLNHKRTQGKKSKQADTGKQQNRRLADDWYTTFAARVDGSKSKYKTAAMVSLLTGCRPDELTANVEPVISAAKLRERQRGMPKRHKEADKTAAEKGKPRGIKVYYNPNSISIEIQGAKQTKDDNGKPINGMPRRKLTFKIPSDDPAINHLLSLRPTDTTASLTIEPIENTDAFANYVAIQGEGLLKKKKGKSNRFSPYNMRNAFASRLEHAGVSDVDRSKALGHCSTRTKDSYGGNYATGGGSSGGVAPDTVTSSDKPRPASNKSFSMERVETSKANKAAKAVAATTRAAPVAASVTTTTSAAPVAVAPVPVAPAPVTQAPVTQAPVTQAPVTQAPAQPRKRRRP